MDLFLVQHGEAKSKDEDPARPLNAAGVRASEASAQRAAATGIQVEEIRHSGKARAAETAEIFARHLAPSRGVRAVNGLAPNDDPAPVAESLGSAPGSLMLVGHLPFLSRLAGLLVTGDAGTEVVMFEHARLVCLRRDDDRWSVVG